jgi:DNA-binding MarR family transcriptional regulator
VSTAIRQEIQQNKPFATKASEAGVALLRTADHLTRLYARVIEAEGITRQQYNVLRILRGAGPSGLPTLEIGSRMIEQTPGITRLLERLEARGFVERVRGGEDRRQVWCTVTSTGLDLLSRLDAPVDAAGQAAFALLSATGLDQLLEFMDQIRESVRGEIGEESPSPELSCDQKLD